MVGMAERLVDGVRESGGLGGMLDYGINQEFLGGILGGTNGRTD